MEFPGGISNPYHLANSPLHRLDSRIKLAGLFVYITICAMLPFGFIPAYAALLLILYGLARVSKTDYRAVIKRSLAALPFIAAALLLPFTSGGPAAGILQFGSIHITLYQSGLVQMAGIMLKSWCSVQAAALLIATTPLADVTDGLRRMGFPHLLVDVAGLMWRYMGITADEAVRMLRARNSRSSSADSAEDRSGGKLAWRAKVTGGMAGSLLVRSMERSERVYGAMVSRGYDGGRFERDLLQTRGAGSVEISPTSQICPHIEIGHLNYQYPDGRIALQDICLSINAGEKVALLGKNGAGKSTLLWHLNGLLPGDYHVGTTGQVRINGLEVAEQQLKRIRAMVGIIFQNPDDQLFSPTVYEDVAYSPIYQGLDGETVKQCVADSLRDVGMEGYSDRVPYHLSMGEKKRIAIATVLASNPSVLAMDEPTAGLDPRARRGVMELLESLPQTMLVATHDLAFASRVLPRSVILYQGRIVADGPTFDLLADRHLLEQYGLD